MSLSELEKSLDSRGLFDFLYNDKGNITININADNLILGARVGQIDSSIRVIYEYNPEIAQLLESVASIEEIKDQVAALTSLLEAYYKGNKKKPIIEKIKEYLEWIKVATETKKYASFIIKILYNLYILIAKELGFLPEII